MCSVDEADSLDLKRQNNRTPLFTVLIICAIYHIEHDNDVSIYLSGSI